jgi:hypothetical protein
MRENWELMSGPDAHQVEILNYANQINVIEALYRSMIYHNGGGGKGCPRSLDAEIMKELHRTATLFLLFKPGQFRTEDVIVRHVKTGNVVYEPPRHYDVARLVSVFEAELAESWRTASPLETAAYALWKINAIHPFLNGNGRTARAFCYACICLRFGRLMPGSQTVIDMLMEDDGRVEYNAGLQWADKTLESEGEPDLRPLVSLLSRLLVQQLRSVKPVEVSTLPEDPLNETSSNADGNAAFGPPVNDS